jgi:putative colanic acid biosynthesis UDP-glucose lipid carrier transferase
MGNASLMPYNMAASNGAVELGDIWHPRSQRLEAPLGAPPSAAFSAPVPAGGLLADAIACSGWRAAAKRGIDIVLASAILVLASPVMAAAAAAIRMDGPGPVLFRQTRVGLHNREFVIFKFRSMRLSLESCHDLPQATRGDARVTRVGRFLRRTSLDELPQVFNVLRGDMSLVGPRPHAVQHHHKYAALITDYPGRHRMRPGITGWAQVQGCRGETEVLEKMARRVNHDLNYIRNWSIRLDLLILLRTAAVVFFDPWAF